MKFTFLALISIPLFIGCSIYRSEGRKQFESEAPKKVTTKSLSTPYELKSCKTQGKLESWIQEEFPTKSYELILAENDLEIWKTQIDTSIEVKVLQRNNLNTQSCVYRFDNSESWNNVKEQFISELENNFMTLEE